MSANLLWNIKLLQLKYDPCMLLHRSKALSLHQKAFGSVPAPCRGLHIIGLPANGSALQVKDCLLGLVCWRSQIVMSVHIAVEPIEVTCLKGGTVIGC